MTSNQLKATTKTSTKIHGRWHVRYIINRQQSNKMCNPQLPSKSCFVSWLAGSMPIYGYKHGYQSEKKENDVF